MKPNSFLPVSPGTAALCKWAPNDTPAPEPSTAPRFLHIIEQGAYLRKLGRRLVVAKEDKTLLEVPIIKLQGVVLYGNAQVSSQCLRLLLDQGVWLSFFTRQGHYKGRLQPPAELGANLRRDQWERSHDPVFALALARTLVRAKVEGAREVAAAYARNYLADTLGDDHATLRECVGRAAAAASADELLGLEGQAARAYWSLFRRWNRSELRFTARVKRGATDPVNLLLNFVYTLLTGELAGLIESAGLDPAWGFYHAPEAGRPALACDWVEEVRHIVADRLVLSLLNRRQIQEKDFELRDEKTGARLSPAGLRTVVQEYERVMTGTATVQTDLLAGEDPGRGYRAVLLRQLGRLLDCLKPEGASYRPHLER